ncbi:uncharacterized protein B0H64DRAFT_444282 [Chaetomium fimeti]|uniref:Uncharacterized protein n=1 Tax=Chaetomium fimeti TaxID=1854472 RepID=A0AAE0HAH8_9PEZI|nr:hypothetical protein B0H64DRAFT_444282 [Chaetomium fimeti]
MDIADDYMNKRLVRGFEEGLAEITNESANPTASELTRAKELYDRQCAMALDTLDPNSDPMVPRELDYHLIHRTSLHDTFLLHLSQRVAELTTIVHSDEHAAGRLRNTNRRLGEAERGLGELRARVRVLEARVSGLARWQEQMQVAGDVASGDGYGAGGGNGGGDNNGWGGSGGEGRKRAKKRKGRGGEAMAVSGGGGGSSAAAASGAAGELGEVEALLAEVMKRVGEFKITSGLDDIVEDQKTVVNEDTEMTTGNEDKGEEVVKTEPTAGSVTGLTAWGWPRDDGVPCPVDTSSPWK